MRKSVLALTGAVAFDLGVMVLPSHAAVDMFLKVEGKVGQPAPAEYLKYKSDKAAIPIKLQKITPAFTAQACKAEGGAVVQAGPDQGCLPASARK